jgi:hypothetical protein
LPEQIDSRIAEVLEAQRLDGALRRESLGPVFEAAGMIRACTATIRVLLDELDTNVALHLELLDTVLRTDQGNRWWEALEGERS